jgi:hypothetical protein
VVDINKCLIRKWRFEINGVPNFTCSSKKSSEISSEIFEYFTDTGSVSALTSYPAPWDYSIIDFFRQGMNSIAFVVKSFEDEENIKDARIKSAFFINWNFYKASDEMVCFSSDGYSNTFLLSESETEEQAKTYEDELVSGLNRWLPYFDKEALSVVNAD